MGAKIISGIAGGFAGAVIGAAGGLYGVGYYFQLAHIDTGDGIGFGLTLMWTTIIGTGLGLVVGAAVGVAAASQRRREL